MTKREYFESQGFHTYHPAFSPDEEADEKFIQETDELKRILLEDLKNDKH